MFYFMIFHSSISAGKDLDKKTLTTFLYGCVMYIILHALLSSSDRTFFATIQQYFWIIFAIDIICMFYIYFKLIQKNNPGDQSSAVFQNLRSKLAGMLDNFIDTSMYTDEPAIRVIEYPAGSGNLKNDPATRGTGKSQLLVHPEGVRLMDFRSSIGMSIYRTPHGMLD